MLDTKITKLADNLLAHGKVKEPPVPVSKLAALAGATIRSGPLPMDLSGFLIRRGESVILGVNGLHSRQRQRFTVAHEIGHLLLHPQNDHLDRGMSFYFRDERSSRAEVRAEIEANQLAADLLMPKWMIDSHTKTAVDLMDDHALAALASTFDVSVQALTYRLTNLGLAQNETRRSGRRTRA